MAQGLSTAFAESVIHENAKFVNGSFEVSRSEFDARQATSFRHPTKSDLIVVDLTDEPLKRLGLNNDISSGDDYALPQEWAKALHDAAPLADGLRYVSRQCNGAYCHALFERSGLVAHAWRPLTDAEKYGLGIQLNVKPV